MTIPLARIHHLEQAIRRRRNLAVRLNSRRQFDESDIEVRCHYGNSYWHQMDRISALFQALHRARTVSQRNIDSLPPTMCADILPRTWFGGQVK